MTKNPKSDIENSYFQGDETEKPNADKEHTSADEHIHEHTHNHPHENTKSVLNRLSRINGHIAAVRRMVEEGRDCPEVLIQLAAVRSAIDGVCRLILKDHLDHCVIDAVETGDTAAIDKLNRAIEILMK